jgi:hypothetical protein
MNLPMNPDTVKTNNNVFTPLQQSMKISRRKSQAFILMIDLLRPS